MRSNRKHRRLELSVTIWGFQLSCVAQPRSKIPPTIIS